MTVLERLRVSESDIAAFCQRWAIREFAIFGSAARDELTTDSDVDVMVEFGDSATWNLSDLLHMQDELVKLFGRDVDLVEGRGIRNPFRRRSMMRDRQVVYAA